MSFVRAHQKCDPNHRCDVCEWASISCDSDQRYQTGNNYLTEVDETLICQVKYLLAGCHEDACA